MFRTLPRPLQILNLAQHRRAIERQIFIGYSHKFHNATYWGYAERIGHEGLGEGGVAFVGCGLEIAFEGADDEDVGGVEGAAEEHASAVNEGDADGGDWALVAEGKVVGYVLEELVFLFDLGQILVDS